MILQSERDTLPVTMTPRIVQVVGAMPPAGRLLNEQVRELAAQLNAAGLTCATLSVAPGGTASVWHGPSEGAWQQTSPDEARRLIDSADLVHAHGPEGLNCPWVRQGLRRCPKRYVLTPHGSLSPGPWARPTFKQRLAAWLGRDRRLFARAGCLHAAVPAEAEFLHQQGFPVIRTLPMGVPAPGTDASEALRAALIREHPELADRRALLVLAPIDPQEGLVPLLKACDEVVDQAGEWQLVLAGSRPKAWFEMIQAAVERRGLSQRVTFVLDPDTPRRLALLNSCAALVQPALQASTAIGALHGLARSKPCAASRLCGLRPLVDAGGGWEFEPRRGDMVRTLADLLASTAERLEFMGQRGREWLIANASWPVLAPRYQALYQDVLGAGTA